MTAMRPLKDFLPLVAPHCSTAPRPVMEQYLRLAAIEWCERTRAWRHITTQQVTENGAIIAAPEYATVHEIESAYHNGNQLSPTQFSHFDPEDFEGTGAPAYITQSNANSVSILPFAPGTLLMNVFLKPRSGTEYGTNPQDPLQDKYNVVPDHLFVQSAEKIAEGALARLLALPKEDAEWANHKMAGYYRMRFDEACDAKFNSHVKGQQRSRRRTRAQWL